MLTAADTSFLYSYQALVANGDGVKVKTFEEIMQEKRLRKQELEEQAKGFTETDPLWKQTAERTLKRKVPSASLTKVPVRKLISLKSKAAASSLSRGDFQSTDSSKENPDAQSKRSVEVKQAKAAKEPEQEHPADTKGTDTYLTEGCISCKCVCGMWALIIYVKCVMIEIIAVKKVDSTVASA